MKKSFKIFVALLLLVASFASQAQTTGTTPSAAPTTPVVTTTSTTSTTPAPVVTSSTTPVVTSTTTPSEPVASVPTATTTIPTADTTVVTPAPTPDVTTTITPVTSTTTTPTSTVATPAPTPVKPVSKPKAVVRKKPQPAPVVVASAPTPAPAPVIVAAASAEKPVSSNSGQKGKKTFGVTGSGYYEINSDYSSLYFSFPASSTNTAGFGVNTYFEYGFSEKVTGEVSLGFSRLTYASQSRTLISESYFMGDIVAHIYFLDNDKFATYGIGGASVYASSNTIAPMADIGVGNYFKITENFSIKTELHLKSAIVLNRAEAKIGVAYHF